MHWERCRNSMQLFTNKNYGTYARRVHCYTTLRCSDVTLALNYYEVKFCLAYLKPYKLDIFQFYYKKRICMFMFRDLYHVVYIDGKALYIC